MFKAVLLPVLLPQRGNSNVHLGCDIVIEWNLILLIKRNEILTQSKT